MMKKLSLLFAAFVLGAIISLAIQACGNDKIDTGRSSSGNDSHASYNSAWDNPKLASSVFYDEAGQEYYRVDYEYDDFGRLIGYKTLNYTTSASGKRYLLSESKIEYTYADSDNVRYGTTMTTQYDENEEIIRKTKTTEKVILYKQ